MCSHIPLKERSQIRKVMLQKVGTQKKRKHSIYIHFTKYRYCDICLRTEMTRVPCRRRDEGSIPRAEKFGDLITAEHKIFDEGSESRNNHRYAVVVQDLATPWITQNRRRRRRACESFWSRHRSQKLFYTDKSMEFCKSCEELSWNHRTSTPCRSETNGIPERAIRRVKEGTISIFRRCCESNLGTITGALSWYKILPLNACKLIRVKPKTSQETERSSRECLELSQKPQVSSYERFLKIWQVL